MGLHTIAGISKQPIVMTTLVKSLPLVIALGSFAGPAIAQSQSFHADYSITLLGLPVAKATFRSHFTDKNFRIDGEMSSAGIAKLFDRTVGTAKVEGAIRQGEVRPNVFSSNYTSGKKNSLTTIRYQAGKVTSFENTPEPRKGDKWIEVAGKHLANALDPLSATLIRTDDPAKVCNRSVRFFDGELRADLVLSAQSSANGAVTCNARFQPVAGYRQGKKQIEYMKSKSRMTITFAALGSTGFYAPVDASVSTQVGTIRIAATRIETR